MQAQFLNFKIYLQIMPINKMVQIDQNKLVIDRKHLHQNKVKIKIK